MLHTFIEFHRTMENRCTFNRSISELRRNKNEKNQVSVEHENVYKWNSNVSINFHH